MATPELAEDNQNHLWKIVFDLSSYKLMQTHYSLGFDLYTPQKR